MALNAYLTLESSTYGRIDGGVTLAGLEETIEVNGMLHSASTPRDPVSGRRTGRTQHQPLTISKPLDKASPILMNLLFDAELITEFTLRMYAADPTGRESNFYTIELVDALIVDIRQEMLNNEYPENLRHVQREHVSFTYSSILWRYEDGAITAFRAWEDPSA